MQYLIIEIFALQAFEDISSDEDNDGNDDAAANDDGDDPDNDDGDDAPVDDDNGDGNENLYAI